jgi:hypothetical protein
MGNDWQKDIPIIGEIDSWCDHASWQERAFHKIKRTIYSNIIAIDALACLVAPPLGIGLSVAGNLL